MNDLQIRQQLTDLTNHLLATYDDIGVVNHSFDGPRPSTDAVIQIAQDLKEVIFPGYRRGQHLHRDNVGEHLWQLIDGLYEMLADQILRARTHEASAHHGVGDDSVCRQQSASALERKLASRGTAFAFLETLPRIRRVLASDVQAAFEGDPAAATPEEIIFCYPGLEAITIHRIAHELHQLSVPLIPRILSEWAHRETGIDIHPAATIDRSFFIDHGTGVVIGETCDIGRHVKLYQGVTLGAWSFPRDEQGNLIRGTKRHPTIEDHVVIYSNATILGGTTVVGRNSRIGASVSLNHSVPANTIVTIEQPSLRYREAS